MDSGRSGSSRPTRTLEAQLRLRLSRIVLLKRGSSPSELRDRAAHRVGFAQPAWPVTTLQVLQPGLKFGGFATRALGGKLQADNLRAGMAPSI